MQRIYAISFPKNKQLQEYLKYKEEVKQRDHRIIGEQQKLFYMHDLSPGCVFFLKMGTRVFNSLVDLMRHQYHFRGFREVNTPNKFKEGLWEISGHADKYKENMFAVEGGFSLKPMNCPSHCLIFRSQNRSYKDLPIRIADFGVLHRNELEGALNGLTRVRKFHQDDAHIFCRKDQIFEEFIQQLEFLTYIYDLLQLEYKFNLSTRADDYIGTLEMWDNAEDQLRKVLEKFCPGNWGVKHKDAAFYGPKIDVTVKDCLGRPHQLGTIQLDFNQPWRFNLQYKDHEHSSEEEIANCRKCSDEREFND